MIDGSNYVISVSTNNVFSGVAENIIIRATNYSFYYDNLYDVSDGKNIVITDVNTKITEITEITDVPKLKGLSFPTEITESLSDTCTINNLLKGGKLCITESNNDAINFISNNTINYYMTYNGTNYKLVIAKKNLFIVVTTIGGI
ncbi:hypothetical protein LY90DRAFT_519951 [Neocallimastix californiae]|uniref:Uncharacterized protein n=1 Tax=Neocallimastix californiae TaxID=1754190 RepID=A0A1Y1YLY9_9FUNG|nr:hypothetical protein LY90DRAFT_519951 [Neocallimastix californiae]|eukprot:ORX98776.1 hypothetical protein LY90DRAFT_519951 [Neocallimastix californiae]